MVAAAVVGLVTVVAVTVPSDRDRSPALEPGFRTVTLDQAPSAVASGFGALWIAMPARSEVVRVDVGSGQVSDRVPVGAAGVVTAGGDAVWSAGVPGNAIDQIDPNAAPWCGRSGWETLECGRWGSATTRSGRPTR